MSEGGPVMVEISETAAGTRVRITARDGSEVSIQ